MIDEKIKKLNFSVISEKHLHGICLQNHPKMFSEAQTIFCLVSKLFSSFTNMSVSSCPVFVSQVRCIHNSVTNNNEASKSNNQSNKLALCVFFHFSPNERFTNDAGVTLECVLAHTVPAVVTPGSQVSWAAWQETRQYSGAAPGGVNTSKYCAGTAALHPTWAWRPCFYTDKGGKGAGIIFIISPLAT